MSNGSAANPSSTPLWRNLNFQLMWTSAAASGFGDRMIELAALPMLGFIGAGAEGGPLTAAVYFWFFLPWLVVTPVGGWLADTLPRKWIMLACDQARAGLMVLTCLLVPAGVAAVTANADALRTADWKVYLVLAAVGAFAAVFSPTRNAIIPQLVSGRQLNAANAIILCISAVAAQVGYFVGAPVMRSHSVRAAVVVAVFVYGLSGLLFIFMQPRARTGLTTERQESQWRRFFNAVRYIRGRRAVFELVLLNMLAWSVAMVVVSAIGSLTKQQYGLPADETLTAFARLNAILGLGMLAGSLLVAAMNARREPQIILMLSVLGTGLVLIALRFNRSFAAAQGLMFVLGAMGGTMIVAIATLTQSITPNYTLGRVMGAREVLTNITSVAVNLLIWQLPAIRGWWAQAPTATQSGAAPGADAILILALLPLGLLLLVVAARGLWVQNTVGPLPGRRAAVLWRIARLYAVVWHRLEWRGRANVPRTGPVILCANHTTGLDPFLMQAAVPRLVCWVMLASYRFRALNFLWETAKPICLDLDSSDLTRLREIVKRLKGGQIVGLFPEGGLQRERRELQPFKPGIGMVAVRSGAMVVPVWIEGTPQARRILWHFLLPSRSRVTFGKPYQPAPAWSYQQIADDLRQRMLDLATR